MNDRDKTRRLPRVEVQERIARHATQKLNVVRTSVRAGTACYGIPDGD